MKETKLMGGPHRDGARRHGPAPVNVVDFELLPL
jgi:hypothetical protein